MSNYRGVLVKLLLHRPLIERSPKASASGLSCFDSLGEPSETKISPTLCYYIKRHGHKGWRSPDVARSAVRAQDGSAIRLKCASFFKVIWQPNPPSGGFDEVVFGHGAFASLFRLRAIIPRRQPINLSRGVPNVHLKTRF
jgi:hypothetical protein